MASVPLPNAGPIRNLIARALAAQPGAPKQEQLAGAIQEVTVETQIAGASLLTVTMLDPDLGLQTSGFLNVTPDGLLPAIDVNFPGGSQAWWRLCMLEGGLDNSQPNLTLTFQDRIVSYLRDHWGPVGAAAGTTTRAQFIKRLVDEVGRGAYARSPYFETPIRLVCPELNVIQPVASSLTNDLGQVTISTAVDQQNAGTKANKQRGIGAGAAITVKGQPPSNLQLQNINTAISIANQLAAPKAAALALFCACIQESSFTNLTFGDGSSTGILQFLASTAANLGISPLDVAACVNAFLGDHYYSGGVAGVAVNYGTPPGGAITIARLNPTLSPGQIAQATQGSSSSDGSAYEQWLSEAQAIYAAGGLHSGTLDAAETTASDVSQLTRGTSENPDEDSWDCVTRLAQEVGWFAFTNGNCFYYLNGDDLIGQKPAAYIDRVKDRQRILPATNWTFDNTAFNYRSTHKVKGRVQRKSKISKPQTPSQVPLDLICGIDDFRAGDVIVLQNFGPANGRWIVADATRNVLGDTFTQLTLEPAIAPYPEPQATATGVNAPAATNSFPTGATGGAAASTSTGGGSYGDPAAAAIAALQQRSMYVYTESLVIGKNGLPTRMNGGTLFGPAPRTMDCSSFAILAHKAAGWQDPSGNDYNGNGNTTSIIANCVQVPNPLASDLCFYGPSTADTQHVTVYVGNGNVISMGKQGDPSIGPAAEMGPAGFLGYWRPKTSPLSVVSNFQGPLTTGGPSSPLTSPLP
jgi:hypothetical protein